LEVDSLCIRFLVYCTVDCCPNLWMVVLSSFRLSHLNDCIGLCRCLCMAGSKGRGVRRKEVTW